MKYLKKKLNNKKSYMSYKYEYIGFLIFLFLILKINF